MDSWNKILENIKDQITAANYRTWFSKTTGSLNENGLIITTPSTFIKQQLASKYFDLISKTAESVMGYKPEITFTVNTSLNEAVSEEPAIDLDFSMPTPNPAASNINPKYTIQNFVVGLSNNLAHAAAQAVINNPGLSYNPLFIYGGTGVGKTHLMHAIGNSLFLNNPLLKVICCSSERFMNDFIQSIQTKKTGDFRAKYRGCDLLLIDDIQFISGRDSTQEEFFHTFNELQGKNTQVVLTSDRPPNEIEKLESRLASRFQGGLMVDIQQPDFDTRVAILKARASEKGEQFEESIFTLIAENMATNARELEGKFIQIVQTAKLTNQPLTEEYVRNLLGKPQTTPQKIDHKRVISITNQYFNIKNIDLLGPRRKKELVIPRQIVMYLLYEECKIPYEKIGYILGGRDHTTIMHGVEKITQAVNRDREIQRMVIEIKQNLVSA